MTWAIILQEMRQSWRECRAVSGTSSLSTRPGLPRLAHRRGWEKVDKTRLRQVHRALPQLAG